ncbi:hypothetical protein OKW43_006336 [Paraburkholderia sp. WC7.3g]
MKCVVELSEAEEMTLQQLSINHMHREPPREPAACLATIGDFLGVPALQLSGRAILQRQETRPLDQTVQNFHELRRHFADGPYARFFGAGDV